MQETIIIPKWIILRCQVILMQRMRIQRIIMEIIIIQLIPLLLIRIMPTTIIHSWIQILLWLVLVIRIIRIQRSDSPTRRRLLNPLLHKWIRWKKETCNISVLSILFHLRNPCKNVCFYNFYFICLFCFEKNKKRIKNEGKRMDWEWIRNDW